MTLTVSQGDEAWQLIRNEGFRGNWDGLLKACPWSTAFQSPAFVLTWYEFYRHEYTPLVVSQERQPGILTGALFLAKRTDSGEIVVAGAHQSEYQVWLSQTEDEGSFIAEALAALKDRYPNRSLVFRYIPARAPIQWARGGSLWSKCCLLEPWRRPIVRLEDPTFVKEYLAQKKKRRSTKSYFNQLRKIGELRFEELKGEEALTVVIDELIQYYDARQMAMHGDAPFRDDDAKKAFHLGMMKQGALLHVTVFRAGEQIVSSQFGIASKRELILAMPIFSPFFADQSPITLHYLLLVEKAIEEGFQILDMTPGESGFKDRFATDHEQVHVLRVFFSEWERRRRTLALAIGNGSRFLLRRVGISPSGAKELFVAWKASLLKMTVRGFPKYLGNRIRRVGRWIRSKNESRVYFALPGGLGHLENSRLMRRNCLDDLMNFAPVEHWQDRQKFLSESLRRLERGNHSYTRVENGRLVHFGWLHENQKDAIFPEVGQRLRLPEGTAVLYDFYTDPAARGKGLYKAAISQILHDTSDIAGTQRMIIAVLANNTASRRAIERLGLIYTFSLHRSIFFGKSRTWTSSLPEGWEAAAIVKPAKGSETGEE